MKLVISNIKHFKFRYVITLILFVVINYTLIMSDMLINALNNGIENSRDKLGADIVITSKYNTENIEDILFNNKPCSTFIDMDYTDKIQNIEHVTYVTSRLYMATLKGQSCCDDEIQLIATDVSKDFLLNAWIKSKKLADNEIILGSKFAVSVGDTVKYFGREFKVKEIIEKTGTSYDLSGFITYNTAKEILKDPRYSEYFKDVKDTDTSMIFVKSDMPNVAYNIINSKYRNDVNIYIPDKKISEYTSSIQSIKLVVNILNIVLVMIGALSILAITSISNQMRKNEIGSMRLIGFNTHKIFINFTLESIITLVLSYLICCIVIVITINGFSGAIESKMNIPIYNVNSTIIYKSLLKTMIINIFIILISVLFSLYNLSKKDIAELIKEGT